MTTTSSANPPVSVEESKVLYALLDAAEEAGRLSSSFIHERWREVKARLMNSPIVAEGALLWELLEEVDRSGAIESTWIKDRWYTIKRQVERTVALEQSAGVSASHTPPFFARHFR